jgi:spore coat protein CotF
VVVLKNRNNSWPINVYGMTKLMIKKKKIVWGLVNASLNVTNPDVRDITSHALTQLIVGVRYR